MTPIIVGIFWIVLLFGLIIWNIYDHIIRLDKQNKEQQKHIDALNKNSVDTWKIVVANSQSIVDQDKEIESLRNAFTILKLAIQYNFKLLILKMQFQ